jgi:hypothetical protein
MISVIFISGFAIGAECLEHLGGGRSDVDCYQGLTKLEREKNNRVLQAIFKAIPESNVSRVKLQQMAKNAEINNKEYCNLTKLAVNEWATEPSDGMSEHRYMDVMYYECLYDLTKKEGDKFRLLLTKTQ